MNSITTVIITRNNCSTLLDTLTRLKAPVIVVDNGSTDGSAAKVRASFPGIVVLELPADAGPQAYNFGARAARTPYVAFSDDRSWWEPGAVSRAVATLDENPAIGLVGVSSCAPGSHAECLSQVFGHSRLTGTRKLPGIPTLGFVDCFCVVRRQPFLDQGGFDSLCGFGGLEQRLALDLADAGWAIRFQPDIVVWHRRYSLLGRGRRVRDDIITTVMRRPLSVASHRAIDYLGWNAAGWIGVVGAAVRMPRALRRRRLLSARVEFRARLGQTPRRRAAYAH